MITCTAGEAFQKALKEALDIYHTRWEAGIKGNDPKNAHQTFKKVSLETLRDWVNNAKGQCPQQKSFQAFLDEAEFPDEISKSLWTRYLAFKRDRNRKNQSQSSRFISVERFTTQQATRFPLEEAKPAHVYVTMPMTISELQKEDMQEHDKQSVDIWKANIEQQGADKLKGISGVDNQVATSFAIMLNRELEQIAKNPDLEQLPADVLAAAIANGLRQAIASIPEANIVLALNEYRKLQSKGS